MPHAWKRSHPLWSEILLALRRQGDEKLKTVVVVRDEKSPERFSVD